MNGFRDWLTSAFGADGGRAVQMVLALVLVVGLLLVLAWVFRRLFGGGLAGHKGGRLSVLDSAHVDGRRRLILLRRDDVEHLVMIGGPNDLLVESRIIRGAPVIAQGAMVPRGAPASAPRQTRGDETEARPMVEDRGEGASGGASKIGAMASMGAAVAGAGAFLKAKAVKSAASEVPADTRRTVDQAFDAPLGREARGSARDVPPPAPPVPPAAMPEPIELPLPPAGYGAAAEGGGRRASVPPMPPQAAMRGAMAPVAPKPPVVEAPLVAAPIPSMPPVVEPVPSPIGKAGAADVEVVPAVKQPTADVVVPPVAGKTAAKTIDDIDLLSELSLGIEELIRIEPKPNAPTKAAVSAPSVAPSPVVAPPAAPSDVIAPPDVSAVAPAPAPVVADAVAASVEPKKKKAPVAPPVAPAVAPPEGIDRLEFLFEEAMFSEPSKDAPSVMPAVVAATEGPSAAAVLGPAVEPTLEASEAPEVIPADEPAPAVPRRQPVDELEEEMARLLAEISGQPKR